MFRFGFLSKYKKEYFESNCDKNIQKEDKGKKDNKSNDNNKINKDKKEMFVSKL